MKVITTERFLKILAIRVKPHKHLYQEYLDAYDIFVEDPAHPILKLHPLSGSMNGLYAFSINTSVRVIIKPVSNGWLFIDIGEHETVYRR